MYIITKIIKMYIVTKKENVYYYNKNNEKQLYIRLLVNCMNTYFPIIMSSRNGRKRKSYFCSTLERN